MFGVITLNHAHHNPKLIFFENRCILSEDYVTVCPNNAISFVDDIRIWDREICQLCGACAEACPTDAIQLIGERSSLDKIMLEIEKDVIYYDQSGGGVTFSGGEPLHQIDFLSDLLQNAKNTKSIPRLIHLVSPLGSDLSGYCLIPISFSMT